MGNSFLFSIIIPSYNCADYIAEAIESVINQTLGFRQNIQLVIVDDGSTDDTEMICKQYASSFPDNIVYIKQANSGASTARLSGLGVASGKYINFLDADDKWSLDACREALRMFENHPDIPCCAARHQYFGAKTGDHPLAYKYRENAVADLFTNWDKPNLSINNLFIKKELINEHLFDHSLKVSEDFLVVNRMFLESPKYGLMKTPTYWYRKRSARDSAIDQSSSTIDWYYAPIKKCYRQLFEESKKKYGVVLPFLQYSVMYDLQWRIKDVKHHPLSLQQLEEYKENLISLLREIDDAIVLEQHNLYREQKLYILALKYGLQFMESKKLLYLHDDVVMWSPGKEIIGSRCWTMSNELGMHVDFMKLKGDRLVLEGRLATLFPINRVTLTARTKLENGKSVRISRPSFFLRYDRQSNSRFESGYHIPYGFEIEIPCGKTEFFIELDGRKYNAAINWSKFSRYWTNAHNYIPFGGICVRPGEKNNCIRAEHRGKGWIIKRELLLEKSLNDKEWFRHISKYRHHALRHQNDDTQIWLLSDRTTMAGDNGEALFRYLMNHPNSNVKPYFFINEDSPDFERMKQYGPVVPYKSDEHKKLHMQASLIISSAADDYIFNCFDRDEPGIRSLEHFKFVFLQHGIIKDDMSGWLNRWNKNIALFITSAQSEYNSIVNNPAYGYGPDVVKLTGLPRHDELLAEAADCQPKRKVLIAPTWRESLAGATDPTTGKRAENPGFEQSAYFEFYQCLLNNPQLAEAVKRQGYEMDFLIHPALVQEAHKFSSSFATVQTNYDYRKEFVNSAIMVTDYSSVAFDFALLRKPVVYAHFDFDTFYDDHPWERGYFNYTRDGFGPVCPDLESTIKAIITFMEKPAMLPEYRHRADKFFYEPSEGSSRCKEVLDAISELAQPTN